MPQGQGPCRFFFQGTPLTSLEQQFVKQGDRFRSSFVFRLWFSDV